MIIYTYAYKYMLYNYLMNIIHNPTKKGVPWM
jgi:hypothetical protein